MTTNNIEELYLGQNYDTKRIELHGPALFVDLGSESLFLTDPYDEKRPEPTDPI